MMEDISNRVTALETKVEAVMESQEKIDGKLDMIMENHLCLPEALERARHIRPVAS